MRVIPSAAAELAAAAAFLIASSRALAAVESLTSVDCHLAAKIKSYSSPDNSAKLERTSCRALAF